ncbi:hypothetical protein HIM_03559 [Hirsutella minnesotensis 3608]|uniref:TauD/TfdA-like domain-containing protein n=1 Tax=Hirsutella minnesotensis 3608 TaxID=1043627 RepID=A0A0F7ZVU8_9HYPO|nr:hypothetical protein HIM_03559 [Hirsutella minnesotensis 3608]
MGCDILALQVRQSALTGGFTYLSSGWTVFNHLAREEPEVLRVLLTPNWPVQISTRKDHYYMAPVFAIHDGRLLVSLDPNRLGPPPGTERHIPPLSLTQKHALSRISEVARRFELRLKLNTGDILFFNNWALLHRRDAYQDDEHTSRHMVRLWLRNTKMGWAVPSCMLPPWLAAYGEASRNRPRLYPLHPMPNYVVPRYSTGSAAFVIESEGEEFESA